MSTNTAWDITEGSPLQRAEALLQHTTLDEKAMQLSATIPIPLLGVDGLIESQATKLLGSGIGHVSALGLFGHKSPATMARTVNLIQRFLVERTRLRSDDRSAVCRTLSARAGESRGLWRLRAALPLGR